jgi:phospholipid-binding lipoprotein MlaA
MRQIPFRGFALACTLTLAGCAHSPPDDPRDPVESVNRKVFWFNQKADKYILKPVAQGYQDTLPSPVRRCVNNFFSNLFYPKTIVNDFLQVKFLQFGSDIGRLVVNSTAGVGGLFDVATDIGLNKHDEDFGQTLGYWGVGPGWFIMLPVFGPSDNRDVVGLAGDYFTNPLTWVNNTYVTFGLNALYAVDKRASFLGSESLMNSQFDPYIFIRTAYLQQRENLVYDGHPPVESIEDDSDDGGLKTPFGSAQQGTPSGGGGGGGAGLGGTGTPPAPAHSSAAPRPAGSSGRPAPASSTAK